MKRVTPIPGFVLLLLLAGCTATQRINQFERFADAGKAYTDAMLALSDEAGKVAVDANSELLLDIREDLGSEDEKTNAYKTHTESLQAFLAELNLLRDHTLLLKRYFDALAGLAASDAPAQVAKNASDVASELQALHSKLAAAKIGDASVSDFMGGAVPLTVAAFQQKALERELRQNAATIERELEVQKAFLQALAEGMRDDLLTIARLRGVHDLARPYIRDARLPASWKKDRQQVLLTSLAVASAENAADAAEELKETFLALVERRVGAAEFDALFDDIDAMLDLIELVHDVSQDAED